MAHNICGIHCCLSMFDLTYARLIHFKMAFFIYKKSVIETGGWQMLTKVVEYHLAELLLYQNYVVYDLPNYVHLHWAGLNVRRLVHFFMTESFILCVLRIWSSFLHVITTSTNKLQKYSRFRFLMGSFPGFGLTCSEFNNYKFSVTLKSARSVSSKVHTSPVLPSVTRQAKIPNKTKIFIVEESDW